MTKKISFAIQEEENGVEEDRIDSKQSSNGTASSRHSGKSTSLPSLGGLRHGVEEMGNRMKDFFRPKHEMQSSDRLEVGNSMTNGNLGLLKDCQHRIFFWMEVGIGEENKKMTPSEVVKEAGVPLKILLSHIRSELQEESSFLSLPFAICLVIIFAIAVALHDRASIARDIEDAVTFDIEENANFAWSENGFMGFKALYEVNTYADFHSWIRTGLRPIILSHYEAVPEDVFDAPALKPEEDRHYYLHYNRILGGAVLKQQRANPSMPPNERLSPFYKKKFLPIAGKDYDLTLNHKPEIMELIRLRPKYEDELDRWFLLTDSEDVLDVKFKRLETEKWLNEASIHCSVNLILYNPYFDSLTYSSLHILQSRSGHLWRGVTHETLFMSIFPHGSKGIIVSITDSLFILQLLWICGTELRELARESRLEKHLGRGWVDLARDYFTPWNIIDWVTICYGVTVAAMFWEFYVQTNSVQTQLEGLGSEPNADTVALNSLFARFKEVSEYYTWFKNICVIYPFMIMLRLFKAFSAQARLALVTRTLYMAFTDVMHFGIVFFAIFSSYAVMGNLLFGREVHGFSTWGRSLNSCFLVLMGDFDVDAMQQVGRLMAGIWFWSFMILVFLIMLNMLLAIIMDTYSNVKKDISSQETLCEQFTELIRRWRMNRSGLRVSLKHIRKCYVQKLSMRLDEFLEAQDPRGEEIVTPETFMEVVHKMSEQQAHRLLEGSVLDWHSQFEIENPLSLSEAVGVISKIHKNVTHHFTALDQHSRRAERALEWEVMSGVNSGSRCGSSPSLGGSPRRTKSHHDSHDAIQSTGSRKPLCGSPSKSRDSGSDLISTIDLDEINRLAEITPLGSLLRASYLALEKQRELIPNEPRLEMMCDQIGLITKSWSHVEASLEEWISI